MSGTFPSGVPYPGKVGVKAMIWQGTLCLESDKQGWIWTARNPVLMGVGVGKGRERRGAEQHELAEATEPRG